MALSLFPGDFANGPAASRSVASVHALLPPAGRCLISGHGIKLFSSEVNQELKKCTWPSWNELRGSTIVVILSVILLSALVAVADVVFKKLLELVTG